MARPPFTPDTQQQRLLRDLGRQKARIAEADAHLTTLIVEAKDSGVPIEWVARAAGVTVKTVYNRLSRSADTDPGPGLPPSAA